MVNQIEIKNFKSIVDLKLELGRVNVIIGANGCGKTNLLESIAFSSAATQNKLDNEYLVNRGVRLPNPQFVKPAFEDIETPIQVEITTTEDDNLKREVKVHYNERTKKWEDVVSRSFNSDLINYLLKDGIFEPQFKDDKTKLMISHKVENHDMLVSTLRDVLEKEYEVNIDSEEKVTSLNIKPKRILPSFLIYTPEEQTLRNQNVEPIIYPLGIRGEGLFSFLKEQSSINYSLFEALNEGLSLLEWFDSVEIPNDLLQYESKLKIGDRYLKESLHYFDQRSANEGFLYLLFYLTLFNSKETPSFFAIDNIETSFNPKLCTHLVKHLIEVAKKNNKQVILTTHSPFVLDGLDLSDDEQRLFVARRDIDGHTRVERVPHREERTSKLSDIWMKGYIGGLPDNF